MKFDKQTILAFVLIGLLIFFYEDYMRFFGLLPERPAPGVTDSTTIVTPPELAKPIPERTVEPSLTADESPAPAVKATPSAVNIPQITVTPAEYKERRVTVETDYYRARFTSKGAVVESFVLKPQKNSYLKDEIEIIPRGSSARPGLRFWTINGPVESETLPFYLKEIEDDKDLFVRLKGNETREISFSSPFDSLRSLSITYSFKGDEHHFTVSALGENCEGLWVRDYLDSYWRGGLRYTEQDTAQDHSYSESFLFYSGNVLENLTINGKKNEETPMMDGATLWGATRTKYFLTAMIPQGVVATGGSMSSMLDSNYVGSHNPNRMGYTLRLPIRPAEPTTVKMYLGPLDDDILKKVEPTLTETMSWGWVLFKPFSIAILWLLKWMHQFIPNYGVCIILFALLIKALTWPLNAKMIKSMASMKTLQPKLAVLKEKYKNDSKKLQEETMKLYKEEKINPLGGCWPLLIQMPLLIALFNVFRATIEFRQAHFVLWIKDLSMPDVLFNLPFSIPFYGSHFALLPVLMGLSTYFQSKATMTDPNQKMMLYMMPILMVVMFNNFPSGLTFYYTLFNILALLQQYLSMKYQQTETA